MKKIIIHCAFTLCLLSTYNIYHTLNELIELFCKGITNIIVYCT